MPKNYYDNDTKKPYYKSDFLPHTVKCKMLENDCKFTIQTTGAFGERQGYLTAGYNNDKDSTAYFVLELDTLKELRDSIDTTIKEIEKDAEFKEELDNVYRKTLEEYINLGYVDHLRISKIKMNNPNGFSNDLFDAFRIEPIFKDNIPDDAGINLGLNYIEFIHMPVDQNKYNEVLSYLTFGHSDIKIEWVGYNRDIEVKKYIEEAKKDLAKYDPSKNKRPSKEDIQKAKEALSVLGFEF